MFVRTVKCWSLEANEIKDLKPRPLLSLRDIIAFYRPKYL